MRIAISGASSFIGKKLIAKSLDNGWEVVAIVRSGNNTLDNLIDNKSVTLVNCDMKDYSTLGKSIGRGVDCYVHLAWNGTRGEERMNEEKQEKNYVYGMNAINSMIEAGCQRIVTAGSQAEYGVIHGIIDEETECRPNTAYGRFKLSLYNENSFSII